MKTTLPALAALAIVPFLLSGCGPKFQSKSLKAPGELKTVAPPAPVAEVSLGEKIFTTGIGVSGQHVAFEQGSTMFKSKPGGCAPCHGEDGKGKTTPQGEVYPAIRFSDLCQPKDGKPAMYKDEAALANPIMKGLDEQGKPLSDRMPRWKFTDEELKAVVGYLQELDTKAPAATPPAAPDAAKK